MVNIMECDDSATNEGLEIGSPSDQNMDEAMYSVVVSLPVPPPPPLRLTILTWGVRYEDMSFIPSHGYHTNIIPAQMASWNELALAVFQYWDANVYDASVNENDAFADHFEMYLYGPFNEGGEPITEVAPFQCWPGSILLFGAFFTPDAPLPFLLLNWDFYPYLHVRRAINVLLAIELFTGF